jgi:hypothetical protein
MSIGEQVLELVRELLEFCQLDHTLSVFQAEAKLVAQSITKPFPFFFNSICGCT